jgi:hypothetical protein
MRGVRDKAARSGAGLLAVAALALLAGCGSTMSSMSSSVGNVFSKSPLDLFRTSSTATQSNSAAPDAPEIETDIECPGVLIRDGAATLVVGSNPKEQEPSPLDVKYQGSIVRTARECHVNNGFMSLKVGIEGRIITGPAGGPGTVEVPLRIAVVQDGVTQKPVASTFGKQMVTIGGNVDRANFTHVDDTISFPLPRPLGLLDSYVVYVGFDPLGAKPPERKKPVVKRRVKRATVPR